MADGLTVNALRYGGLTAGPSVRIAFGRAERDNPGVLRGLGNIGAGVELGAFAAYDIGPVRLRAVVGQDVASGHKGFVGELGATWTDAVFGTAAGPWLLAAGPTMALGDARYQQSYYGITPSQSAASGRPVFTPSGGLVGVGGAATLIVPITERLAVTGILGYTRLVADPARSPLVRGGVGSLNQLTSGLFLSFQIL